MARRLRSGSDGRWPAHAKARGQGCSFAFQQREPARKNSDPIDQSAALGAIEIESDRRPARCTLRHASVCRAIAQCEAANHQQQQDQGDASRERQRIDGAQARVRHGTGGEDHKCHGRALVGRAAGSFQVGLPSILARAATPDNRSGHGLPNL
jgi:hypothetical protein